MKTKRPPANKRYAWDYWFGLGRFVLIRGTDYSCSQSAMAQQARSAASAAGLRLSVRDMGDKLEVIVRGERT